jgi:DUF1009 family protein
VNAPPAAATKHPSEPIAIVCGGGALPAAVADAALGQGRAVFLLGLEGWADPDTLRRYPHAWVKVGQLGRGKRLAAAAGCREVVFIGTVLRPAIRSLRLDWTALRLLPRIFRIFRGGDDHLLSGFAQMVQEHGFRLVAAHEVAPDILAPVGALGKLTPAARDLEDAERGFALIDAMGPFDVGQAVVVADGRVLAVEAAEGTDRMLDRIAALREDGRIKSARGVGVLVKAPKPGQDRRLDLPSIGPATVERVNAAGLAGIVVRAGAVQVADLSVTAARADAAGVFVAGLEATRGPA